MPISCGRSIHYCCAYTDFDFVDVIQTPSLIEDMFFFQKKFIFGVGCSARGPSEYALEIGSFNDKDMFTCICGGIATSIRLQPVNNRLACIIYWWECPMVTN